MYDRRKCPLKKGCETFQRIQRISKNLPKNSFWKMKLCFKINNFSENFFYIERKLLTCFLQISCPRLLTSRLAIFQDFSWWLLLYCVNHNPLTSSELLNRYVELSMTFFRLPPLCNGLEQSFPTPLLLLPNKFDVTLPLLIKSDTSVRQRITKLGKKIIFFTDSTHLL